VPPELRKHNEFLKELVTEEEMNNKLKKWPSYPVGGYGG